MTEVSRRLSKRLTTSLVNISQNTIIQNVSITLKLNTKHLARAYMGIKCLFLINLFHIMGSHEYDAFTNIISPYMMYFKS